ncbi:MAG: GNAT family N-acetyltransferase [Candidatus Heimdallarchaeota archaeon]|nr:GNAT family N-acetyltransferase [Candidatus Heimdallarchaeota archaeon]MCK5143036.1 GNAT family N-acetyltransferase [Candidatus Heimdallarchaeota archaeon]
MSEKEKEILDAIENSMFMHSGIEGVLEELEDESVKGYVCPMVNHEEFNVVGKARLSENETEQKIAEITDYYKSKGLSVFSWVLSPQSKPYDLEQKLIDFGFKKEIPVLGMVRPVSKELELEINDEFEYKSYRDIEAVELIKSPMIQKLAERAYGMPEGAGQIFNLIGDRLLNIDYNLYIAYDKTNNEPVAFGAISTIPDTKIAVLNGAATLPEYRKRGIYSSFLKLRYELAKSKGLEQLIIQAKEATSAPIASKYGFEKVCELPFYVWRAEKE